MRCLLKLLLSLPETAPSPRPALPLARSALVLAAFLCAPAHWQPAAAGGQNVAVRGVIVDADTQRPIAARIYIQDAQGNWYFPQSAAAGGSAVEYRKQRGSSVEMHTTLSADPFVVEFPSGTYTIHVERGKEYLPATETIEVAGDPLEVTVRLKRFLDMASLGWYSGETHVHRTLEELPNLMLAEDLNVSFPLTSWVTRAFEPPAADPAASGLAELVRIDDTHVFWPRNTEFEITTIGERPHTLGAFFAINQRTPFRIGVPPVGPVAEQAHREGALIELDKHNWPWSMMLVPVMKPDLYELANNHLWRTEFGFPNFGEPAPDFMHVETDAQGFTERGWIEYAFRNYYALLNCGYRLRPTAGTASGVHPVPLGFGRVYVHLPGGFRYDDWVAGLSAGRSFVTTGPMLLVTFNGQEPGHHFTQRTPAVTGYRVKGRALSEYPLRSIEIVSGGEVVGHVKPQNKPRAHGGYESTIDVSIVVGYSAWLAARCYEERPDRRIRFAHTGPVHIDIPGKHHRPRKAEVEFLQRRVAEALESARAVLPSSAIAEYEDALNAFSRLALQAR